MRRLAGESRSNNDWCIGACRKNRTLAAKPLAATICSGKDKLQRSFAAKYAIAASGLAVSGFAAND